MLDTLQMIFFTLVALGVLVTIHEFGHFWVARRCGVKVLRFSIGFGTPLLRWMDKQGTEYVIALLPLGGYVKMVDEREGEVSVEDRASAFNVQSVWRRMAIVVAGPLANFFLAIVAYWFVYLLGVQGVAPIVDDILPGSVADRAGLEQGQEIVAVDGEKTPTWQALGEQLLTRIGEEGEIRFTVKYPDSNLEYETAAELQGWQVDADAPDPVKSLGIVLYRPQLKPIAEDVVEGGAAAVAGMLPGDLVIAVDGQEMKDWSQWVDYVSSRPEQLLNVVIERDGEKMFLDITPAIYEQEDGSVIGRVGMSVKIPEWPQQYLREMHYGPVSALTTSLHQTWKTTKLVFDSIKKMITGLISPKHLSGPITIAKVAGASAQYGLASYLGFLALLSISLGVLNLLPVPVLDGGHLLYFVIEAVKGSPVSERIQMAGYRAGMFLVVGLMIMALYNDVMRL
jgi:regulator of sigma E protease